MTDAPDHVWVCLSPDKKSHLLGPCTEAPDWAYRQTKYIRADLVPQPPQEPTPEAVERAAVRVKPLEWVQTLSGEWWGNTPRGLPGYVAKGRIWCVRGDATQYSADNEDAAKAAAQAHFDEVVISALTAPA